VETCEGEGGGVVPGPAGGEEGAAVGFEGGVCYAGDGEISNGGLGFIVEGRGTGRGTCYGLWDLAIDFGYGCFGYGIVVAFEILVMILVIGILVRVFDCRYFGYG
jgi:hypothetical protein